MINSPSALSWDAHCWQTQLTPHLSTLVFRSSVSISPSKRTSIMSFCANLFCSDVRLLSLLAKCLPKTSKASVGSGLCSITVIRLGVFGLEEFRDTLGSVLTVTMGWTGCTTSSSMRRPASAWNPSNKKLWASSEKIRQKGKIGILGEPPLWIRRIILQWTIIGHDHVEVLHEICMQEKRVSYVLKYQLKQISCLLSSWR